MGAPSDCPDAVEAQAIHMRRQLERAAEWGAALLDALNLSQLDALDAAIATLDALDEWREDREQEDEHGDDLDAGEAVDEDGDDLDCGEHDPADAELSLGWPAIRSQLNLGDNTHDGDATALERHGRGFVCGGPDDSEEDDPAEDDGIGEPGEGAWEGNRDQRRWCAAFTPPRFYSMRVVGDCLHPVIPDGALCILDSEAPFQPGDFVVVHHDDPKAENGIASKVKQLAHNLPWSIFPVVSEAEILPVISVRMLNPRREFMYDPERVHAVHKVVEIERPGGEVAYV